jgi:hypothetical protein
MEAGSQTLSVSARMELLTLILESRRSSDSLIYDKPVVACGWQILP